MKVRVCIESVVLVTMCLADMLFTLYCVMRGVATEQNPIMAACMSRSLALFVLVKMLSFVPFVVMIEWYRHRKPEFARSVCRCAIALYLIAFVALTAGSNLA